MFFLVLGEAFHFWGGYNLDSCQFYYEIATISLYSNFHRIEDWCVKTTDLKLHMRRSIYESQQTICGSSQYVIIFQLDLSIFVNKDKNIFLLFH